MYSELQTTKPKSKGVVTEYESEHPFSLSRIENAFMRLLKDWRGVAVMYIVETI